MTFLRQDGVEDAEESHPNTGQKVRGKDEMCEVEDVSLHTAFVGRLLTPTNRWHASGNNLAETSGDHAINFLL